MQSAGESDGRRLRVTDMHTAGEAVRIFDGRALALGARTLLEARREVAERHDAVRRLLMHEPRGHAEMYGALLLPPFGASDAAVLFTHGSGYSTMCGHAAIAVGRFLHDAAAARGEARRSFRLECPCGVTPLEVSPASDGGIETAFDSVPAFAELDAVVRHPAFGPVRFDVGYGGAFYAVLPASRLGLNFFTAPTAALAAAAGELVRHLRAARDFRHPTEPDLSFLYGAILTPDPHDDRDGASPHLCWFGEGQIDRSPTGSGVAARLAVSHARGELAPGQPRTYCGVSGARFVGRIVRLEPEGVVARVSGRAYYTAQADLILEPGDPFPCGFRLPDTLGGPCRVGAG